MAVKRPDARIIQHEIQDDEARTPELLRVSALRILGACKGMSVPTALAFGNDEEIMAVEMHGLQKDGR